MRLSQLHPDLGLSVHRDGDFRHLGKSNHTKPDLLVFVEAEDYVAAVLANPAITCVLTTRPLAPRFEASHGVAIADRPRDAFYRLHDHLRLHTDFYGPDFPSEIHPTARIHPASYVAPRRVRIGAHCIIEARATLLEDTTLGEHCIVRSGATLGAEGFEFRRTASTVFGVAHAGGLVLADRVEVQNNSVIEKAPYGGVTRIGTDTKIGGAVLIAHNGQIGERCLIAGGVTISGNVTLGNDVWIGPGSTLTNGITLGDGAHVTLGSVVVRNVPSQKTVTGNFAVDHALFLKQMSRLIVQQSATGAPPPAH